MGNLDDFHRYIKQREQEMQSGGDDLPSADFGISSNSLESPTGFVTRYAIRNGVTVLIRTPIAPQNQPENNLSLAAPTVENLLFPVESLPKIAVNIGAELPTIPVSLPEKAAHKNGVGYTHTHKNGAGQVALPLLNLAEKSDGDSQWDRLPQHLRRIAALLEDDLPTDDPRYLLIEKLLDPVMTLDEAAKLLGVCSTTVRRYANKGALAHQRTPGQQRRFRLSEVAAFLDRQQLHDVGEIE